MRYRTLDSDGDMTFGQGSNNFLVNSPEAVAQLVMTRLKLWRGEWFLDTTEGVPYSTQVLGKGTMSLYDHAIKAVVLTTTGVTSIDDYSSLYDPETRKVTITATISTSYGSTEIMQVL